MWELDHNEGWALKNWCFQIVVLEKTLKSPLDCKEMKPIIPKGSQPWILIGRTDAEALILWPPNGKSRLIWKDSDAGKDWGQEEKGVAEDEMVGWHHQLNVHEFEQLWEIVEDRGAGCAAVQGSQRVGYNLETKQQQNSQYNKFKKKSLSEILSFHRGHVVAC